MANLGSLLHSPGTQPMKHIEEKAAQLVVLRTETGTVYVRPSRWQRIRLQWMFRNFHVLSTQVLSRRDQRLIAYLARFAVVTPDLPVWGTSVLGVIEKAHTRQAEAADPVFGMASAGNRPVRDRRLWNANFGLLGALAAICVTVILTSALASRTSPLRRATATKPLAHMTTLQPASASQPSGMRLSSERDVRSSPMTQPFTGKPGDPDFLLHSTQQRPGMRLSSERDVSSSPMTQPFTGKPGERSGATCCTPSPLTTPPPRPRSAELPSPPQPSDGLARLVAEPLPGPPAHPVVARVVAREKLDGEVQLKVLIGTDGAVKAVTVVRGDPRLAEAGVRAVRRWHYQSRPVEAETQVTMKFFGPDAVSIASVTNPSAAVLR